jgi:hypothetical protein
MLPPEGVQVQLTPLLTDDDRRAAERYAYPADSTTQVYLPAADTCLSATVRDISATGVGVRLSQRVNRNALVLLQFRPSVTGQLISHLAAVMYCNPSVSGGYAVGCKFTAPLTHDAQRQLLAKSGGRATAKRPAADRRATARVVSVEPVVAQLVPVPRVPPLQVRVKDVSPRGIGLVSSRPVERGTLLALESLTGLAKGGRNLVARVAHVTPHDGEYLIGCEFDETLSEDEVRSVLAQGSEAD